MKERDKHTGEQTETQAMEASLIASAMDAILAVDEAQNIVQFNAAAERVFGYQAAEVLGKPVQMLVPENFRASHLRQLQNYAVSGVSSRNTHSLGALTGLRANGEIFPIEISISRVVQGGQKLYFAILRDVSERLKLEQLMVNQYDALNTLHQITLGMLNHRDIAELLQFIVNEAAKLLNAPYCEIMLPEGEELIARALTKNHAIPLGTRFGRGAAPLSWKVFETGMPSIVADYSQWEVRNKIYEDQHFHAAAGFPILVGSQCTGVLGFARSKAGQPFKEEDILSATRFADIAALAMENARLYREIETRATTDELTSVHNRRSLLELGEREVQRAQRYGRPFSVLMLDVDHFKRVNDTWGHPAGDIVLRGVAQQCTALIRRTDVLGRYGQPGAEAEMIIGRFGGEEFLILLPETALEQSLIVAERLRTAIERMIFIAPIEHAQAMIQVTASLGAAALNPEADKLFDLLTRADQALYAAKHSGRNRVCLQKSSVMNVPD